VTSTHSPGTIFPAGTTTVTYTATDAAGNTAMCSFDVTIIEDEAEPLACPDDIITDTDPGLCEAVVTWTVPTAASACADATVTSTHDPGAIFPVGTTTVTYTVTFDGGGTDMCSFDVTVEDNEAPVVNCPADIVVNNEPDRCDAEVTFDVMATDNCGIDFESTDIPSGTRFDVGTTTVTYTATDIYGNTSVCEFDVTVIDSEPPVIISCPADVTANGPPGECMGPVAISVPMFGMDYTDNCPATIANDQNGTANASGIYEVGTTTVIWTVTDASGNTATCEQMVTLVEQNLVVDTSFITDKDVLEIFFFFRPEGNSCEEDVIVELTDPAGTVFTSNLFTTCTRNDAFYQFPPLNVSIPPMGGQWKLRFKDDNDQNPVAAGPVTGNAPAGTEFSVRFGIIRYDIIVDPDCDMMVAGENDDSISEVDESSEIVIDETVQEADFNIFPDHVHRKSECAERHKHAQYGSI